jgi:hypothetical protein
MLHPRELSWAGTVRTLIVLRLVILACQTCDWSQQRTSLQIALPKPWILCNCETQWVPFLYCTVLINGSRLLLCQKTRLEVKSK